MNVQGNHLLMYGTLTPWMYTLTVWCIVLVLPRQDFWHTNQILCAFVRTDIAEAWLQLIYVPRALFSFFIFMYIANFSVLKGNFISLFNSGPYHFLTVAHIAIYMHAAVALSCLLYNFSQFGCIVQHDIDVKHTINAHVCAQGMFLQQEDHWLM